jgi:hypothetical protein
VPRYVETLFMEASFPTMSMIELSRNPDSERLFRALIRAGHEIDQPDELSRLRGRFILQLSDLVQDLVGNGIHPA